MNSRLWIRPRADLVRRGKGRRSALGRKRTFTYFVGTERGWITKAVGFGSPSLQNPWRADLSSITYSSKIEGES
jgi:hypothetical protein